MIKFVLMFLFSIASLSASTWQDEWADGLKAIESERYHDAEISLDRAISFDDVEIHVYVDRADLYVIQERYAEAMCDLDYSINNKDKLSNFDLSRAYGNRAIAKSCIDVSDETAMQDLKDFAKFYPNMPKVERGKKNIVIKNALDSTCYQKAMTCHFIHTGQCNSKHDIQVLQSGDWIIKKACDCGCKPSTSIRHCDACGIDISYGWQEKKAEVDRCKKWCVHSGIAANVFCTKSFSKSTKCKWACLAVVNELADACFDCCADGSFFKTCVEPYNDILKYMNPVCKPDLSDVWTDD